MIFLYYLKYILINLKLIFTFNSYLVIIKVVFFIIGGKTKEGYSLITFPDTRNFIDLSDEGYEKLISYVTSVPSYVF